MQNVQTQINAFNQAIYNKMKNEYAQKLIDLNVKIDAIDLPEKEMLLEFTKFPVECFMEGNFNFSDFFERLISKKNEKNDLLEVLHEHYEDSETYMELNVLYKDWRILINEIGEKINVESAQFLNALSKEISMEEEKIVITKEKEKVAEFDQLLDEL